jgi:hypothetical protein
MKFKLYSDLNSTSTRAQNVRSPPYCDI